MWTNWGKIRCMIHGYTTLLLTLAALGGALFCLWEEYRAGAPVRPYWQPLIVLLILVIALLTPTPVSAFYKAAVMLGLILSLLGSAIRLLPGMPLAVHKAHLLLATLLYLAAFAELHPVKLPTPWLLLLLLYAGGMAWLLGNRVAELQSSLLVYGVILLLMSWQAVEAFVVVGQLWTGLLLMGALCFVIADSLQALDQFYRRLPAARLLTPAIFLLGQLLLALSIWGPGLRNALG